MDYDPNLLVFFLIPVDILNFSFTMFKNIIISLRQTHSPLLASLKVRHFARSLGEECFMMKWTTTQIFSLEEISVGTVALTMG